MLPSSLVNETILPTVRYYASLKLAGNCIVLSSYCAYYSDIKLGRAYQHDEDQYILVYVFVIVHFSLFEMQIILVQTLYVERKSIF